MRRALGPMRRGKDPGPSGIWLDHLKECVASFKQGTLLEKEGMDIPEDMQEGDLHLFLVVRLVQDVFRLGRVQNAFQHLTLVLVPNQEWTKYRGIALLEVLHKLCSSMINCRLNKNIGWHEGVHRFRMGKGCTMASIETKLPSEKARLAGTVLFHDFLDLSKVTIQSTGIDC